MICELCASPPQITDKQNNVRESETWKNNGRIRDDVGGLQGDSGGNVLCLERFGCVDDSIGSRCLQGTAGNTQGIEVKFTCSRSR